MNNKGIVNLWILIVLVIIGLGMISGGTVLMLNNYSKDTVEENNKTDSEVDSTKSEWKKYKDVEHYEFGKLEATNLADIEVKMEKISFETYKGTKGTLDFSQSTYVPSVFGHDGFEGYIYMTLHDNIESLGDNDKISDASIFNDVLNENQKIIYYKANEEDAYANVALESYGNYWSLGVNIESKSIDEAVAIFKQLIPLAVEYDDNAPTIAKFTGDLVKQIEFNVPQLSFENVELNGSGLVYQTYNGKTNISSISSHFYSEFVYAENNNLSVPLLTQSSLNESSEVKEINIWDNDVRIYRYVTSEYSSNITNYYIGIINEDKEYVFNVYEARGVEEIDENDIEEFLRDFIKEQ